MFPLGKSGHWARLGLSAPASLSTAFTAEYVPAAYATLTAASPLSEVSQVEYWTLDGGSTTDTVRVRLFWEDAFRSGIDTFSSDLQVASFDGTQWNTLGNGGLGGSLSAGSVRAGQATGSFTAFTFGSLSADVNPLSTQLTSFQANQPSSSVVALRWTLTSESNTYGYAVERSAGGGSWQQIGFVASQGISGQARTYAYQDQAVQGLTQASYRLRQNDPTGAARYSDVASVTLAGSPLATTPTAADGFAMFPNPASRQVTLRLPAAASGSARVVLTDLSGRTVLTQTLRPVADTDVSLLLSLAPGVYLLQVQSAGLASKPQRLVIQ